jgi:hypothetical protein
VSHPDYRLRLVREGVGRRTLRLNNMLWQGLVHYVEQFEVWVLPQTELDPVQRLAIVGELKSGEVVVFETTVGLFRKACEDLAEH